MYFLVVMVKFLCLSIFFILSWFNHILLLLPNYTNIGFASHPALQPHCVETQSLLRVTIGPDGSRISSISITVLLCSTDLMPEPIEWLFLDNLILSCLIYVSYTSPSATITLCNVLSSFGRQNETAFARQSVNYTPRPRSASPVVLAVNEKRNRFRIVESVELF